MTAKKESKVVVLPLADGTQHRFLKSKITLIGTTYELNSKTPKTVLWTGAGKRYVINLNEKLCRALVYGGENDKSSK